LRKTPIASSKRGSSRLLKPAKEMSAGEIDFAKLGDLKTMDCVEKDERPNVMGLVRAEPIGELVFRPDRNPNP
jgi:hypothetical protein